MGDYDSPCYRPAQDVVIPARTCRSISLEEHFPTVEKVKPMRERPNLMTWSGTYWGTGKSERLRLTCNRGGVGKKELIPGGGPQDNFAAWDYMNDLSNARFCPQPRGIAGMSPPSSIASIIDFRLVASYLGCDLLGMSTSLDSRRDTLPLCFFPRLVKILSPNCPNRNGQYRANPLCHSIRESRRDASEFGCC